VRLLECASCFPHHDLVPCAPSPIPTPQHVMGVFSQRLHDAASAGDDSAVEELLQAGAEVNSRLLCAHAIHWAAYFGHTSTLQVLLAHGASVDVESSGRTAQVVSDHSHCLLN